VTDVVHPKLWNGLPAQLRQPDVELLGQFNDYTEDVSVLQLRRFVTVVFLAPCVNYIRLLHGNDETYHRNFSPGRPNNSSFSYEILWRNSDGVECRRGMKKIAISINNCLALSRKLYKIGS